MTSAPQYDFVLAATPPFRLDLTAWVLRRRIDNQIDHWDGQTYRRLLPLGPARAPLAVAVRQDDPARPEIQVTLAGAGAGPAAAPAAEASLRRMLGLDVDLTDFYRLAAADPLLAPLAERFRGFKPPRYPSVFETLTNAIACQQITLTLGITLLNRLAEAYGGTHPVPAVGDAAPIPAHAFPLPEELAALAPEALRPLGFSGRKAEYIIGVAGAIAAGDLDLEALAALDNAAALENLLRLRGVGRWSAEYVLLRGLGRLDTFPGDDVGARNGLQRWLGREEKMNYDAIQQEIARWQPYGGLIYFHMLLDSLDRRGAIVKDEQ